MKRSVKPRSPQIIQPLLTQTTSEFVYLLMVKAWLIFRAKNLALHGKEIFRKVVDLTHLRPREEIKRHSATTTPTAAN